MADNRYYLRIRGKVQGPFSLENLQDYYHKGQLSAYYEISPDGQNWQPVGAVKHLLQPGSPAPEAPAMAVPLPASQAPLPDEVEEDQPPSYREAPGEPWYYRFLEIYTKVAMWLALALLVLSLLGMLFFVTAAFLSNSTGPVEKAAFFLLGLPALILVHLLWGLAIVFAASLLLLLVDMGRRLRSIDRKTRKH